MSFSGDIKTELSKQQVGKEHCRLAELQGIFSYCGQGVKVEQKGKQFLLKTENLAIIRKCFTLLKKQYNICMYMSVKRDVKAGSAYRFELYSPTFELPELDTRILQKSCCKRAFLRGAFLAAGSLSDPEKGYHFEIVCTAEEKVKLLQGYMEEFGIESKMIQRKKNYVLYIKEGTQIADALNVIEAHVSLMNFENIRILKDMRNSVNRKVNCETANLSKTVSAAVKQTEDIKYIRETIGFQTLPEGLSEVAEIRLNQPEATLKELGEMLCPPVGKSGVNHRLRKLSLIAEELKNRKEERL